MEGRSVERRYGIREDHFAYDAVALEVGQSFGGIPVLGLLAAYVLFGGIFVAAAPGIEVGALAWFEILAVGIDRGAGMRVGGNRDVGTIGGGHVETLPQPRAPRKREWAASWGGAGLVLERAAVAP